MKLAPYDLLERVRREKPVVHHLTNWVTIYDCAQVVKCLGGSPVMAHATEEVGDMVQIASAVVLNIGTLTVDFVEAMTLAARSAKGRSIPVILDVCGAGATKLRDDKCMELLDTGTIGVIKGNVSEVARIGGRQVRTRGVDATEIEMDVVALARKLAIERAATVVVTGKTDIVTDGRRTYLVNNGHEMMTRVVGTGCMAASVIGTFAAVSRDLGFACSSGLACYGIAGQLAASKAAGPASFKEALLDCLYGLDGATVQRLLRLEEA